MFQRIAVVNRGEAAVRLIRAVRELNAEHGYGIRTVALHTEAERRAMFVRQADEAITLRSQEVGTPYLNHEELARALKLSGADAAWVGWGFVAEDADFADLCVDLGITLIGPPPEAMRKLGDKVTAKVLAEQVGAPVAPWSGGPVESLADARRHAQNIGYPLIIKARSGGGGRGIRKVNSEDELQTAFERTQGEAQRSFGDPVVFLERLITEARHVEVQVMADAHGNVWAPGVRDCSIQRRNQKLIEESSSPLLSAEQSEHLREVSGQLVLAAGYRGAGTVEYLYQPEQKIFTFLEVNTRLQVEHPITEATTGLDLVKLQLQVASGEPLVGSAPPETGHAVEARLNAEDADNEFAAAPGTVRRLNLPMGPGIRVDTGIGQGDVIPPEYDSMVAKIIAWGPDRSVALARLRTALRETTVVIEGGTTTKSFLLELLNREEVTQATADTGWLDRAGAATVQTPSTKADIALLATAVDVYEAEEALERARFFASARGGRPRADDSIGRRVELSYQGQAYTFAVEMIGPHRFRVTGDPGGVLVDVENLGEFERRVATGRGTSRVVSIATTGGHLVEVDGVPHRISRDEGGLVRAPSPAVVMSIPVSVGDEVEAGDTLIVLESMKMEALVRAPQAGQVSEVLAAVNTQVDPGASLIRLESAEETSAEQAAPRVRFDTESAASGAQGPHAAAHAQLNVLRALITGYDVTAARAREVFTDYERTSQQQQQQDPELLSAELALLTTFADICELSRNRPTLAEQDLDTRVHSPREFFHSYLHSLDPEREGLPQTFQDRLSRALGHFGVNGLEHTPELEQAVYRVFLAQQRIDNQIPVIVGLLEHWLEGRASLDQAPQELEEVLDRVLVATQTRYPVVGDVARSLRYRIFEQPRIQLAREEVYDRARGSVTYLANNPDASDRSERIENLVAGPEPLLDLLAQAVSQNLAGVRELLEVVSRRYYKIRTLTDVKSFTVAQRPVITGTFELSGAQLDLISTVGEAGNLATALTEIEPVAAEMTGELVLDLYLSWIDHPDDPEVMAQSLRQMLRSASWLSTCRRVTVTVGGDQQELHRFTFRPADGQLEEERVIRDMHPLQGQRMELWRFKNFDGTRLPAEPDTYLFHLVGKENPADERVVALAEIRDVTPARDDHGNVVGMPMAERTLAACLHGIRRARTQHSSLRRLTANRVVLYVWPVLDLPVHEVAQAAATNIAPLTADMGLEEIALIVRVRERADESPRELALRYSFEADGGITTQLTESYTEPLEPMDDYTQKVQKSRSRGTVYPYEIIPMLTGEDGTFTEHDLDEQSKLVPVERPYGQNTAGLVAGVVTTPTTRYPDGMTRVVLFGDPTKALGSLAEPECARVVAALDLADEIQAPVEWFALSAGAQISMERGTENMDWVSQALRRIVNFTQDGGEINIIVAGINVGAQPYWNAEATMLMHTRGILVMTPNSAMVLTGKHSLDYAGGVSAEDNFGIGGYDRVMGPNGQAQYWAPNLSAAVDVLTSHYDHTYVAPGESFPRPAVTSDPVDRDVCSYPHTHPSSDFTTVGDIFSATANPERKKPYDIRTVMRAVVDQDLRLLERWADMADADTSVVFDAHLGGTPVCLIGIESRAVPRTGQYPTDGPDQWTAGTLFPQSSKKTARAINATSGNRPLVVLANLSGFDGSPESMRNWQLEFGAEIGRAIVNFDGPIIFCVVTRYHGGAFVVFSGKLNDNMEIAAVEGSYASVLGGSSAAAVVFTREVNKRTSADSRVRDLETSVAEASESDRAHLQVELRELRASVRAEKLSEVASEFDATHSIERARSVGSVDSIVAPDQLRPYLVDAVERGLQKARAASSVEATL